MNQVQHLNQTVHNSVLYSGWQYDDMGFASSGLQTNLNLILSFCWNLLTLGSDWWGSQCILVSLPARIGLDQTCNRQGQAPNSDLWTKYGLSVPVSTWNDLGHLPDTQGYSGLISPLNLQGGCWGGGWSIRLAQRPKSSLDWTLASGL